MPSAHAQAVGARPVSGSVAKLPIGRFIDRTLTFVAQIICGLRGHLMVLHSERSRLSLRCFACGAETPGWTIDVRPEFRHR